MAMTMAIIVSLFLILFGGTMNIFWNFFIKFSQFCHCIESINGIIWLRGEGFVLIFIWSHFICIVIICLVIICLVVICLVVIVLWRNGRIDEAITTVVKWKEIVIMQSVLITICAFTIYLLPQKVWKDMIFYLQTPDDLSRIHLFLAFSIWCSSFFAISSYPC